MSSLTISKRSYLIISQGKRDVLVKTNVLSAALVAEDIAVERLACFVDGGLAPAAGVVTEGATLGYGRVETGNLQVGVRRRRPVALLRDQPRRWHLESETSMYSIRV